MQFGLVGQENQDANLVTDNYVFFLSGSETGKEGKHVWKLLILKLYAKFWGPIGNRIL